MVVVRDYPAIHVMINGFRASLVAAKSGVQLLAVSAWVVVPTIYYIIDSIDK